MRAEPQVRTASRGRAERSDSIANRERVMEAARSVMAECGLAFEMDDIAERAQVAVGTIYNQVGRRDDLVASLLGELINEKRRAQARVFAIPDPADAITFGIRITFTLSERYGKLMHELIGGTLPASVRERLDARFVGVDMVSSTITPLLERGKALGRFRQDLDVAVATGLYRGIFAPAVLGGLAGLRSHEEMAREFATLYLTAISAPASAS
jgi:AcrR family transcriptional regulator